MPDQFIGTVVEHRRGRTMTARWSCAALPPSRFTTTVVSATSFETFICREFGADPEVFRLARARIVDGLVYIVLEDSRACDESFSQRRRTIDNQLPLRFVSSTRE